MAKHVRVVPHRHRIKGRAQEGGANRRFRSHAASERVAPPRSVRSAVDELREGASDCSVRLDNASI
jgi:hypothetical protein